MGVSRDDKGFTLIETLIVMVVIGIMAAIAAPSLLSFTARAKVSQAFAALHDMLQTTQREAMKRSQDCTLTLPTNDTENAVLTSDCLITGTTTLTDVSIKYNNSTSMSFDYRGNTSPLRTIVVYSRATDFKKCMVISNGIGMMRQGTYTKNDLTEIKAKYCETSSS